ncbi:hypothetical protein DY000_02047202 [Brassica cretica]|uniref:Uncharacterized protein n=1 Tax=Brassica cretica TaxID=69181 RepID=A0ABQ7EX33_BRACR|nr:hypothetical protein DY000_02047202 [Brassica cretica]
MERGDSLFAFNVWFFLELSRLQFSVRARILGFLYCTGVTALALAERQYWDIMVSLERNLRGNSSDSGCMNPTDLVKLKEQFSID